MLTPGKERVELKNEIRMKEEKHLQQLIIVEKAIKKLQQNYGYEVFDKMWSNMIITETCEEELGEIVARMKYRKEDFIEGSWFKPNPILE